MTTTTSRLHKARAFDLLLKHYKTLVHPDYHSNEDIIRKFNEALKLSKKFKLKSTKGDSSQ